jgi:hypothetical protein
MSQARNWYLVALTLAVVEMLLFVIITLSGGMAALRAVVLPPNSQLQAGLEKGPLTHRVTVVDSEFKPVAGAKLKDLGFGTSNGSGMAWLKSWPKDFETDAAGVAVISVPDVSEVHALGLGGIVRLSFGVKHPTHPVRRVASRTLDSVNPIRLDDPLTLRISAVREGSDSPLTADLFVQTSGYDVRQVTFVDGVLQVDALSPTDPDGGRYLRVIHAPVGEPAWFSDLVDLQQYVDDGGTGQLELKLYQGVRVEGKLADEVPRPVNEGTVSARIVDGANHTHWQWADFARLQADGTFVFESLPRETDLQLIAVCDGWASRSPSVAEINQYSRDHGLKLRSPYTATNGVVTASLCRLSGRLVSPVLAMQRTTSCAVTVVNESGKPIGDVEVGFSPNQMWLNIGTTVLGNKWSSLEALRMRDPAPDVVIARMMADLWKHYAAATGSEGTAIVRALPQGRLSFGVQREGYELVPNPHAGMRINSPGQSDVDIRAGETARATVTMRHKK